MEETPFESLEKLIYAIDGGLVDRDSVHMTLDSDQVYMYEGETLLYTEKPRECLSEELSMLGIEARYP